MPYELVAGPSASRMIVESRNMQVGRIGVITSGAVFSGYVGQVVLKTYNALVSLTNPGTVWNDPSTVKVEVIPGAEVTIKGA